ncbi:MAG: UvrD-helicase domain-containing protein [Candidatus Andersenbacteria bacterium]
MAKTTAVQQAIELPQVVDAKSTQDLTPAQSSAVTHGAGPLLIIAGAGSGKTMVITRRLGYLLTVGLKNPKGSTEKLTGDQILAVTFSNKATEEMEERLDKLMPVGFDEPWINTFHAFGERVLRENALALGLDPGFTVLTPAQQHVLLRRNLDQFELDFYRPSGNPTKFISALIQHFSRAKDEAVSPAEYVKWAEGAVERAAKAPGSADERAAAQEEAARQLEVAKAYQAYEKVLVQEGVLDVADLITKTLELFTRRPSVLAKYRRQFKAILVDEFQDTNTAQYELIKLLAHPGNNLVVVADDDQAIYRWRGASVANVLQFMSDFPKAKQVALIDNFRSRQPILDAAYRVVQHNNPDRLEHKLKINKKLTAVRGGGDAGNARSSIPVHYQSQTLEHEVMHLTQLLIERNQAGLSWSEMAVLVRSNAAAEPLIAGLAQAHVPFSFMASKGLFARPEILDLLAWLRVVADYHDSTSLYRLLSSDIWRIPSLELIALMHYARRYSQTLFEAVRAAAQNTTTAPDEQDAQPTPVIDPGTRARLLKFLKVHEQQVQLSSTKSAGAMLLAYLSATKLLDVLEKRQTADDTDKILNINQLLKLILDFERDAKDKSARAFLEFYELLLAAGESPAPADIEAHPDAVRILTVHASKGLEFSLVALFHAVEQQFPSRARRDPIALPLELVERHEHLGLPDEKTAHLAEERRLFYVACTRARDELIVTTSLDDGGVRKRKPSRFIAEAGIATQATPEQALIRLVQPKTEAESDPSTKRKIKLPLPKRFSYTQLTVFDTCPLQYKYAHIYKIPSLGSHVFSYGKSLHETMAAFYRELGTAEPTVKSNPGCDRLLELLDHYWINEWYQSPAHERRRKTEAQVALKKWFETEGQSAVPAFWVEQDFTLKIGQYSLHGRIDRADKLPDGTLEIIDYKTGQLKKEATKKEREKRENQLGIYALAAQKTFKLKASKLTWIYLDAGQKVSTMFPPERLAALEQEIDTRIKSILGSEFIPTPGFHCKFCDFKNICEVGQASGYV